MPGSEMRHLQAASARARTGDAAVEGGPRDSPFRYPAAADVPYVDGVGFGWLGGHQSEFGLGAGPPDRPAGGAGGAESVGVAEGGDVPDANGRVEAGGGSPSTDPVYVCDGAGVGDGGTIKLTALANA